MLEHDIHAALVGYFLHFLRDLLFIVIDGVVSANVAGALQLGFIAGGGNDTSAVQLGDLDGGGTHAGSGSQHEDEVSGLHATASYEHVPGGEEDERDAGKLVPCERDRVGWNRDHVMGW